MTASEELRAAADEIEQFLPQPVTGNPVNLSPSENAAPYRKLRYTVKPPARDLVAFRLEPQLHEELREVAVAESRTVSDLFRDGVRFVLTMRRMQAPEALETGPVVSKERSSPATTTRAGPPPLHDRASSTAD